MRGGELGHKNCAWTEQRRPESTPHAARTGPGAPRATRRQGLQAGVPVLPGARAPHDQQVRHINRLRRARGGQAPGRRRHVTRGCRLAHTHPTQQGVQEFPSTSQCWGHGTSQCWGHAGAHAHGPADRQALNLRSRFIVSTRGGFGAVAPVALFAALLLDPNAERARDVGVRPELARLREEIRAAPVSRRGGRGRTVVAAGRLHERVPRQAEPRVVCWRGGSPLRPVCRSRFETCSCDFAGAYYASPSSSRAPVALHPGARR